MQSQYGENLDGVGVGLNLRHHTFDYAVFINDVSASDNTHGNFSVQLLFLPDTVCLNGSEIRVGEKDEGQGILLGEFNMRCGAVTADTDDFYVFGFEFIISVGKSACLTCASGSVVLWIKVQHNLLSEKIGEGYGVSVFIRECEVGSAGSCFEHDRVSFAFFFFYIIVQLFRRFNTKRENSFPESEKSPCRSVNRMLISVVFCDIIFMNNMNQNKGGNSMNISPYFFRGSMDEVTLRRYAAKAVTYLPLCSDDAAIDEGIRMILNIGAKFVGRAAMFSWNGHMSREQVDAYYEKVKSNAEKVHHFDPEIILQAGVFEIIYRGTVDSAKIPDYVFEAFGLPAEDRCFDWEKMLFPEDFDFGDTSWGNWGGRNFWNREAAWPFIGSIETQMYFYSCITRYIDAGFEAVHLGQAEKMMGCRREYLPCWDRVTTLAREYAKTHARRGIVLFDCHTIIGGCNMKLGDRLILDMVGAGMVPVDWKKEDGVLKCRIGSPELHWCTWIGRSEGGIHPLGFECEVQPTLVEFDNYGRPGPVGEWNDSYTPWGYDDITWFTLQPDAYRNEFLLYCDEVLSTTCCDRLGQAYFLQPQLRRCISCNGDEPKIRYTPGKDFDEAYFSRILAADGASSEKQPDGSYIITAGHEYRANTQSDACPMGFGQEETIKRIFAEK